MPQPHHFAATFLDEISETGTTVISSISHHTKPKYPSTLYLKTNAGLQMLQILQNSHFLLFSTIEMARTLSKQVGHALILYE